MVWFRPDVRRIAHSDLLRIAGTFRRVEPGERREDARPFLCHEYPFYRNSFKYTGRLICVIREKHLK